MILKNKLYTGLVLFLLLGCGSTKNVTVLENLPTWVKTKPTMSGYYVGLGSAPKTMNLSEYQINAKNKALSDLTSEISTTISTQSVLNRFESSLGFAEDFVSLTKSSASENLEGYELVYTYESPTHYYVLYKLSKATFNTIKEQRKNDATQKGLDYLKKAHQLQAKDKVYDALFNYVKGLEAVKPYLSESLPCDMEGKATDLGNELYTGLMATLNNIVIVPRSTEIDVVKGQAVSASELTYAFRTQKGNPIQGIPVIFSLGSKPLRNNKSQTNILGEASYELNVANAKAGSGYFVAQMDANEVAAYCASDPLIRKMMRNMDMPQSRTLIRVDNPTFYIETTEQNFGSDMNPQVLKRLMEQLLSNNDYPVVYAKEKALYMIVVNTNTTRQKKEGRMIYASLSGEIKVFNNEEQLLFVRPIEGVTGVQLNLQDAGYDAYNNLSDYLKRNFLPKLKEALY